MTRPTLPLDPRISMLTPDKLRTIVESSGAVVTKEWDYVYPPEEYGDGVRGHLVLYLALADGSPVGNVGFSRVADDNGNAVYQVSDYWDDRHPMKDRDSTFVVDNPKGFLRLLTAFVPAE